MAIIRDFRGYSTENVARIMKFMQIAQMIDPTLEIYETGRTQITQDAYYSCGRESYEDICKKYQIAGLPMPSEADAKRIITWTVSSKHTLWLAFDVVPCINGRWYWDNSANMRKKYEELARQTFSVLRIKQPLPNEDQWHFEL